jgi:hypothetical protein
MLKAHFPTARARFLVSMALIILLARAGRAGEKDADPGTEGDGSHTIGPDYKIDPDLTDLGKPKGKTFEFSMPLEKSKVFRGDDPTLEPGKKPVRNERKIFVYVPAAYKDGTKAPVLVIHDGPGQLKLVSRALDNLTIAGDPKRKLPAFIAIAVENGGSDSKNSERGLARSEGCAQHLRTPIACPVARSAEQLGQRDHGPARQVRPASRRQPPLHGLAAVRSRGAVSPPER